MLLIVVEIIHCNLRKSISITTVFVQSTRECSFSRTVDGRIVNAVSLCGLKVVIVPEVATNNGYSYMHMCFII